MEKINGTYTESMDMYKIIKDSTCNARNVAQSFEIQGIKNREDILVLNPHTSIYKILNAIDEFNEL